MESDGRVLARVARLRQLLRDWRSASGEPAHEGLTELVYDASRPKGYRVDWTGEVRCLPDRLDTPLHWRKPRRVFVDSMSDLFHPDVPDEFIGRVWQTMGMTPEHTYQILTKRPQRMAAWLARWTSGEIVEPYRTAPLPGFPNYMIDTHGHVHGPRVTLSADVGELGHKRVTVYNGTERARVLLHRAVLETFGRKPRAGEQACHRNGDASDNRLSNLRWGTQSDNWSDRIAHGNGRSYAKLNLTQVGEIRNRARLGESAASIARAYGISDTQVRNIVAGRQWVQRPIPGARESRPVLDNCWIGTSVENQRYADLRIPHLLATPAAVRFLSVEPLLGPVDLTPWLRRVHPDVKAAQDADPDLTWENGDFPRFRWDTSKRIDWVIIGGESGPGARPMEREWAQDIVDVCHQYGVAVFVKQLGTVLGGKRHQDVETFPTSLQAREYLTVVDRLRGEHGQECREDPCLTCDVLATTEDEAYKLAHAFLARVVPVDEETR